MNIKKTSSIFFLLLAVTLPAMAQSPTADEPSDFNAVLNKSLQLASIGKFTEMDGFLEEHPSEWLAYDRYGSVLEAAGYFDKAESVYLASREKISEREEEITERLQSLQVVRDFHAALEQAPIQWGDAKTYSNSYVTVKTNIPLSYVPPLLNKINETFEKASGMLNTIFEIEEAPLSPITVLVFANVKDMAEYLGTPVGEIHFSGTYLPEKQELVMYFNGYRNWEVIVHEMCHFLFHQYVPNPSLFLDEAIATYISAKLEKNSSKAAWRQNIEWINWSYDQGAFQHALDFLKVWHDYENPYNVMGFRGARRFFYMYGWTLTGFFLEGNNPEFTAFFKNYLNYERGNKTNNRSTVEAYFKENLSAEQIKTLDSEWSNYFLGLTFEKI